jgi:hypothetical protein
MILTYGAPTAPDGSAGIDNLPQPWPPAIPRLANSCRPRPTGS